MGVPLRRRLWSTLRDHNEAVCYSEQENPSWYIDSDVLSQTEPVLARLLGLDRYQDGSRVPSDLHAMVTSGPAERVFDVIEIFHTETPPESRFALQQAVNDALVDFACAWRLSDGMFFRVDSEFLENELLAHASELLEDQKFEGANDEFRTARDKLTDGSARDAITYAAHSVESTLKATANTHSGDAKALLQQFVEDGFMDDVPLSKARAVAKAMQCVSILRNELGGHGQGSEILDPPQPYAELAIHLAASVNRFVIGQYLRKNPRPDEAELPAEPKETPTLEKEIPF